MTESLPEYPLQPYRVPLGVHVPPLENQCSSTLPVCFRHISDWRRSSLQSKNECRHIPLKRNIYRPRFAGTTKMQKQNDKNDILVVSYPLTVCLSCLYVYDFLADKPCKYTFLPWSNQSPQRHFEYKISKSIGNRIFFIWSKWR